MKRRIVGPALAALGAAAFLLAPRPHPSSASLPPVSPSFAPSVPPSLLPSVSPSLPPTVSPSRTVRHVEIEIIEDDETPGEASIDAVALDRHGRPIVDLPILVELGHSQRAVATDADGRFRLDGIPVSAVAGGRWAATPVERDGRYEFRFETFGE